MKAQIRCLLLLCLLAPAAATAATQTLFLSNSSGTAANDVSRVVVAHDPLLQPTDAISIEAWIRPSSTTQCRTIVGKGFATAYWLGICDGEIRFYTDGSTSSRDGNGTVATGAWTHIAVTFDGNERRYYINGDLDYSEVTPGPIGVNGQALGIGGEGSSSSFPSSLFPYTGYLSEVRLWSSVRSQTQIRTTMYEQLTREEPGLIGVWALEGGAEDRFGGFVSTLAPGAVFSGLDSPPLPFDPLRIRSVGGTVTVNGACLNGEYGSSIRMPTWYPAGTPGAAPNPNEIFLGADASFIYVCLPDRVPFDDPLWIVEIDTDGDGGTPENNDYRFRNWPSQGGLTSFQGRALPPPFGGTFDEIPNPSGLAGEVAGEFTPDMEWRIPRSLFADPSGVFRIRVAENFLDATAQEVSLAWPDESRGTIPDEWAEAVIDLSSVGPPDYRNPSILTRISNDEPRFFEDVEILVEASDDSDVELVELLVDGVVVQSENALGASDSTVSFTHTARYAIGTHTYQARVFDQAGRENTSRLRSFRVLVDGNPPTLSLSYTPTDPAPGQAVRVTARARDVSGVQSIVLRDVLGFLSPSFERCDFGGTGGVEVCTWVITPPVRVLRLRLDAMATDSEGFVSTAADQVVLFGNDGPDRDGDGLSDLTEGFMCTDPDDPDTDRDGLSDGWEVQGIRFDDGSVEPLVDYGVNPCWKNVLLQLDYELGARPPASGIANLRNRYRENGISVYLDMNERPRPTAYDQSHVGAAAAIYQLDGGEYYFSPARQWAFYYGYERNLPGRSGAWGRSFTVDHNFGSSGFCSGGTEPGKSCRGNFECAGTGAQCVAGCSGGTNEGMSCSNNMDCPLDDGSFANCSAPCTTLPGGAGPACLTIGDLPYRLFHEFGHVVGLGHGGRTGTRAPTVDRGFVVLDNRWDSRNYKPNHQSAMNYLYSQGNICMEPLPATIPDGFRPTLVSELDYMTRSLGDLNEDALSESPSSTFALNLRAGSCAFASSTAFPVLKYTCKFGDTQYEVLSDGNRTLARRPRDGDWDFTPPTHAPGIDWNCNGVIDGGTVAENINGPGWYEADGFWDETAWRQENNLRGQSEFDNLPNPVDCQVLYRANCDDRPASCYVWPQAYRNAIPTLDTGLDPVDCREVFLANRGGNCGGGPDSDFGTSTCPAIDRDSPLTTAFNEKVLGGFDDHAGALPSFNSDQFIEVTDDEQTRPTPGLEFCDGQDNDGDGQIDESCADLDADGVVDAIDNCDTVSNSDQADRDLDGLGDACQFPGISNLAANWDGSQTVSLSWDADSTPATGYVIYRYGVGNPDPVYRGGAYPSALTTAFNDTVTFGDEFTYVVRALNLNGKEGEPVSVSLTVDIDELVFADSFEQ
ncbi:MAG: LamG-like jellyroll fold domain-containing protein [Pseudomonadota bacterium]